MQAMLTNFFWIFWDCIHIVARALPRGKLSDVDRLNFIQWFTSFAPLIPCPGCKEHAMRYILKNPIRAATGDEAFAYTVEFHNEINRMNNKPQYTVEEAEAELESRCNKEFKDIPRAEMIQKQAGARILALQKELAALKLQEPNAKTLQTSNSNLMVAVIVAIVVAFLALLAILILGCLMLAKLNAHIAVSQHALRAGLLLATNRGVGAAAGR